MAKTVARDKLTAHLDRFLRISEIPDASPNGLQVQGAARVKLVACAVDASLQTITAATRAGAQMLIVHHGLWWGKHEQIVGNLHGRVAALIRSDLSLYAAHLPLDCHPEVGNNVELARLLGARVERTFASYRGIDVGVIATLPRTLKRAAFVAKVGGKLECKPSLLAFGPESVKRIGIVSGNGAAATEEAARAGCDALLTGETSHSAFHPAREAGINLVFAGHYATETVGLRALDRHLRTRFGVKGTFIHAATGL